MPSPITSGFSKSVSTTATSWHTLEVEQALAQQSSDRNASLTNQLVVRLQRYGSNKLQDFGSPEVLAIVLDQFTNITLVMLMLVALVAAILNLLASRFPEDAIAISVIELHRTEELNFSFPEGRRHSIELKDLLSNTIADYGYTLQDGVASVFPSSREVLRALSSTGLSVVMFVWLELKKSFTSVRFTVERLKKDFFRRFKLTVDWLIL